MSTPDPPHEKKKGSKQKTGIEVKQASYGANGAFTDVTKEVQGLVQNGTLNFTVSAQTFGVLDPAPGVVKTFQTLISINGGKTNTLSKNDGEVFVLNAPEVEVDVEQPSAGVTFGMGLFYFILALMGSYFALSAYKLGIYGFKSKLIGYLVGAIIFGSFVTLGLSGAAGGVIGLLIATPPLIAILPLTVFVYSLYDPAGIDFNYPDQIKNVDLST